MAYLEDLGQVCRGLVHRWHCRASWGPLSWEGVTAHYKPSQSTQAAQAWATANAVNLQALQHCQAFEGGGSIAWAGSGSHVTVRCVSLGMGGKSGHGASQRSRRRMFCSCDAGMRSKSLGIASAGQAALCLPQSASPAMRMPCGTGCKSHCLVGRRSCGMVGRWEQKNMMSWPPTCTGTCSTSSRIQSLQT